eukprot:COSAG01_NODE_14242_length_1478_cov_2.171139_1_plen_492_part_11
MTDASSVTIDRTAPTLSPVTISSTINPAGIGSQLRLTFGSSELLNTGVLVVRIAGHLISDVQCYELICIAKYTVRSIDTPGTVTFSIGFSDLAGNAGTPVTASSGAAYVDADKDGIPDVIEGDSLTDTDGDGSPDYLDEDSDGDGLPDAVEGLDDADGDGIPDYRDLDSPGSSRDSDSDGIPDVIEGGGDPDADGIPNYIDTDSDGDGILDSMEGVNDQDSDDIPNFLDTDSDADGLLDSTEGGGDADGDALADFLDNDTPGAFQDSDSDGLPDIFEGDNDVDDDGVPNHLDTDSYGDGILDSVEGVGDADNDGTPNFLDLDSDNDGLSDASEGTGDTDTDGVPDYLDSAGPTIDTTIPTLTLVTISSITTPAGLGAVVTVSFTASERLSAVSVTIAGRKVTSLYCAGTDTLWTCNAQITVTSADPEGIATFKITFSDVAGNAGTAVTSTSDSSSVTIDRTAPTLAPVTISSTTTPAGPGSVITVAFTASEA